MEPIYPLREDVIHQFCGMPVCVIMNDGTRHVGILSSCRNGKVLLNAETSGGAEAVLAKVQPQAVKKKKGAKGKKGSDLNTEKAHTQAYLDDPYYYGPGSYYPWGGALALDLALIAFLFLLL
ncbi:hypothetical protein [Paenibacillus harenae]|uniref:hypothetical protein n=1 Tax=Paenibacillus harenae TaxID=306543 RepID=UPI0004175A33|nr:hypothetical protein [Paenibacillus harenae]